VWRKVDRDEHDESQTECKGDRIRQNFLYCCFLHPDEWLGGYGLGHDRLHVSTGFYSRIRSQVLGWELAKPIRDRLSYDIWDTSIWDTSKRAKLIVRDPKNWVGAHDCAPLHKHNVWRCLLKRLRLRLHLRC
jgi:hypothetical protein